MTTDKYKSALGPIPEQDFENEVLYKEVPVNKKVLDHVLAVKKAKQEETK